MAVADEWSRRKRRMTWVALLLTVAMTAGAFMLMTLPTVRKIQSRGWPTAKARVQRAEIADPTGKYSLLTGRRVRVTFAYATAEGERREAKQEVSASFAERLGISGQGYIIFGRAPVDVSCCYQPSQPGVAVLERSIGHGDVPALIPLVVLAIGLLLTDAERRAANSSADPRARAASRNDGHWDAATYGDGLNVTAKPSADPFGLLAQVLVGMPIASATVAPHPLSLGEEVTVTMTAGPVRRRGRRRVRARLMVGRFNSSGSARHADWSADVFDGTVGRDDAPRATVRLPRSSDLPAGAVDCWLRISWRTRLGIGWSRAVWLSLDDARR